ncbi:MAG: extracellular solute-binding protein [Cyanobacteriota bacterium]|nr:extracellular solute-binding protein [Cyanobacteriota bacterium]
MKRLEKRVKQWLGRWQVMLWAGILSGLGVWGCTSWNPPLPTLTLFSPTDYFAPALQTLAATFSREQGIPIQVVLQGYPELYQRAMADFVGHTAQGDLYAVDAVWTAPWGNAGYLQDLSDEWHQDQEEMAVADVLPVAWELWQWQGKTYGIPLSLYAGVLSYRADRLAQIGMPEGPTSMRELLEAAAQLTTGEEGEEQFGITLNGARSAPVAQDWMFYMVAHGGSLLNAQQQPTINQPANLEALHLFADLFAYAPRGATTYAWIEREQAFQQGRAALQIGWSTGARDKYDPQKTPIADRMAMTTLPMAEGIPARYPVGGWGLGINQDSQHAQQAWQFLRWLMQPTQQRELMRLGAEPYRRSLLADPDHIKKFPYFPVVLRSLEQADSQFRPRIPNYARLQDALGLAINEVITQQKDPETALFEVQAAMVALWPEDPATPSPSH